MFEEQEAEENRDRVTFCSVMTTHVDGIVKVPHRTKEFLVAMRKYDNKYLTEAANIIEKYLPQRNVSLEDIQKLENEFSNAYSSKKRSIAEFFSWALWK